MTIGGMNFEDEVRRVARQLWPESQFSGAANADGRERDGVFETEWVIHLIEATTWRTKAKAEHDIDKLSKLRRRLSGGIKPVIGWFITESEPTADQRSVAPSDGSIRVLSFEQFRAKLVDAHSYLRDRAHYPFGSARDPASGASSVAGDYVPVQFVGDAGSSATIESLVDAVDNGERIVLLGDYGMGKSMAMRETFSALVRRFRSTSSYGFPIHLNLRDHHGQIEPAEALERHARSVGFAEPSHLVRGWRAGNTHLLLDGFDELATPGWIGSTDRMRETRRRSVELVRRFIKETPPESGVLVAGREHYFDNQSEMSLALGTSVGFKIYRVGEFTEEQIRGYLTERGWAHGLPEWLPARPLLLSYLAGRNLLETALSAGTDLGPALAWDSLLDLICSREADIEANIDSVTLRAVIERLASLARGLGDGLGPIEFSDIDRCFRDVAHYAPDDRAMVLLQRLPGLGQVDPEAGTRRFVDADLADVARSGDVLRWIVNPYAPVGWPTTWEIGLGELGLDVVAGVVERESIPAGQIENGIRRAAEPETSHSVLAADLVRLAARIPLDISALGRVSVRETWIESLRLDDPDARLSSVEFESCVFTALDFPRDGVSHSAAPLFRDCHFGTIDGRVSDRDLPQDRFVSCEFDQFSEAGRTTAALLGTSLPLAQRVALSILKKLFVQRGRGRKESALYRGLDQGERALVPEVVRVLEQNGFILRATSGNQTVWLPARGFYQRASAMLDGPAVCDDIAWLALGEL